MTRSFLRSRNLVDVLDRALDKGIVFDASLRASLPIELAKSKARVVVVTVEAIVEHHLPATVLAAAAARPGPITLADALNALLDDKAGI